MIKKDDVVTLVLTNGAEIIGKYVSEDNEGYVVNKPRMLQASQTGVGLVNGVCMSGEEPGGELTFNRSGIIFIIKTAPELAKGYQEQVSGIVLPTGGLTK
jgi:hypothetical protein